MQRLPFEWNVGEILRCKKSYAILILNHSLTESKIPLVSSLWNNASLRACVDGGTNEFHKYMYSPNANCDGPISNGNMEEMVSVRRGGISLPNFISGDFDSIEQDVMTFYKRLGVNIIHTPDQNYTDFEKALIEVKKRSLSLDHVIVITGVGEDRFDHVLAFFSCLLKALDKMSCPVICLCERFLFWMLPGGTHKIHIPPEISSSAEYSWCCLAAFNQPSIVSTTGLKYDMDKDELCFGKLTSTSNTYAESFEGKVIIETSHPVLWMMGTCLSWV